MVFFLTFWKLLAFLCNKYLFYKLFFLKTYFLFFASLPLIRIQTRHRHYRPMQDPSEPSRCQLDSWINTFAREIQVGYHKVALPAILIAISLFQFSSFYFCCKSVQKQLWNLTFVCKLLLHQKIWPRRQNVRASSLYMYSLIMNERQLVQ